jgi:transposase
MTNSELRRLTNCRLKVLQAATSAGHVARTCRHFGISRKTFYKWRQRYHQYGDTGLVDRARAPHRSPRATPAEVVSKILYLRQHYHFGPGKIADYLKRFYGLSVACASVHRILRRHGMNRLPANQKYRRHARLLTGQVQVRPAAALMRTDPLSLVTRSTGPPPPIEPDALPFDTDPCNGMPAMLTEPERLVTSTVAVAAASSPISTLPDPVEASHARVGPPSSDSRPL